MKRKAAAAMAFSAVLAAGGWLVFRWDRRCQLAAQGGPESRPELLPPEKKLMALLAGMPGVAEALADQRTAAFPPEAAARLGAGLLLPGARVESLAARAGTLRLDYRLQGAAVILELLPGGKARKTVRSVNQ